jgi:glycosyltransferase involved in cell wall biosynthesis
MLASVRGLVGEMIVVDTGSSDQTPAIAQAFGAQVFHHRWNDDFAEARNRSLSYARYPWILVLDADEVLSPDAAPLIQGLVKAPAQAYSLLRHHFCTEPTALSISSLDPKHPASERGAQTYFATHDIRLFPNDPRIRFFGEVHESAEDSLRSLGYEISRVEGIIFHYGNLISAERKQSKADLYLSLAQQKASAHPHDWRAWFHLGVELQNHQRHIEALYALNQGLSLFPDFAPMWRQLGISLDAQGDYKTAMKAFSKALGFDHVCHLTWNALGITFMKVQSFDAAERCFETVLAADATNPAALTNREIVRRLRAGFIPQPTRIP